MRYIEQLDNIFMIDTMMFGFKEYMSAYLVKGEKLALIDTGVPSSWNALLQGIKQHGFSIKDISHIFIGHEHPDHYGNASRLLDENPYASVYIHPAAETALLKSEKEQESDPFSCRAGVSKPVPRQRIVYLNDGDMFDLGGGEILQVLFTPGHLPGAITIYEKKHKGLFLNDLIGNYFPDANAHLILLPPGSDLKKQLDSMKKLIQLGAENIFCGHFGIVDNNVAGVMSDTLARMYEIIDIGQSCLRQNQPGKIVEKMEAYVRPYSEAMRQIRGEEVYDYITSMHLPHLLNYYSSYCLNNLKEN